MVSTESLTTRSVVEGEIVCEMVVNGEPMKGVAEPRTLLVDFLRHELGLTGTHVGCEHGVCGACTILVDDQPVRSCLILAVQARGTQVRTVEGLAQDEQLDPLQTAFHEKHGLQCGFCTPGMLMAGTALLERNPDPDENEIREYLSGNVCRCTGYMGIVDAVKAAAAARWDGGSTNGHQA
ncbi:MAG TPA: (2Fe-2S)-binding protein [Pseudonocardia sp.]|jgi:carbon-monoxide dehydrogenase small subunit|nr:(2Fe-2S)-binding protein [Pseudonocardia sp.]